jgi:signal transduction histidine kinase
MRAFQLVGLVAIYLALEWISAIQEYRGVPVTAWNPGLGVLFAGLLRGSRIAAFALFVGAILAESLLGGGLAQTPHSVVIAAIVTLGYVAVAEIARALHLDARLERVRDVALLLSAALGGAVVVGMCLNIFLVGTGSIDFAQAMQDWLPMLVGDLIGIAVVTPLVLRSSRARVRAQLTDMSFVAGVAATTLVAAAAITFVLREGDQRAYQAFYFLFLPIVFAALRNGLDGACITLASTQLALLAALNLFGYDANAFTNFQTVMAVLTATGLLAGAVSSERDAASRSARSTRALLKEKESEAARADRFHLVTGLASALSHEINQPMTAARAYARTAQKLAETPGADVERVRDYVNRSVEQIDHAAAILRSTREFLRRGDPGRAPTMPATIVADSLTLMRPLAVEKRVGIASDVQPALPACYCDRIQIQQVLMNLMDNSIAALAGQGRKDGAVTLSARLCEDSPVGRRQIEFSVRDNGPGVDPEFAARVFEALATTKKDGLGLGLAISAGIVEAHGGRIWLQSGAPGATEFRFIIPAAPGLLEGDISEPS